MQLSSKGKSASENAKALKHMFKSKMKSMKEEKSKNKALHGQYPRILQKPRVDTVTTNKWLSSNRKGKTEGLLVVAQDQAVNTRNYKKVISGQQVESKCRMCSQHEETVDHIVSGCEVLAKQSTSPGTIKLQRISTGASVKIMISRLQTNGTNTSQRL